MKFDIGILRMAHSLAGHASARQSIIAENIANSDTPGFRARDIASFAESFADSSGGEPLKSSRASHLEFDGNPTQVNIFESAALGAESPNGNSVSLEDQMVRSAEVKHQHDLALGIYGKSIDILRAGMGRVR